MMTDEEYDEYSRARRLELLRLVPVFLAEGIDPLEGIAFDEGWGWSSKGVEKPSKYEYRQLADDLEAVIKDATRVQRSPGQIGSWGRGRACSWQCALRDGGGCECAGCGATEHETRTCFYREPMGKKT